MALVDVRGEVSSFAPVACPGCKQEAPVSTKVGTSIACPCGVSHTVVAIIVESKGECSDPEWRDKRTAAERAERAKRDAETSKAAHP